MKAWALALLFFACFAAALASTVPISLAASLLGADRIGLSAADVSGSIWNARLRAAQYRGIPLGNIDVALDPVALLTGTRRVTVRGPLGSVTLVRGGVQGFESADAAVAVENLGLAPSLGGNVRLEDATLLFSHGRCTRAEGRIATDVVERAFGGPMLSGGLSCAGDAAIAQLEGRVQDIEVSATVRVAADGHYKAETRIGSSNPVVRGALALAGFSEHDNRFVRSDEGALGL